MHKKLFYCAFTSLLLWTGGCTQNSSHPLPAVKTNKTNTSSLTPAEIIRQQPGEHVTIIYSNALRGSAQGQIIKKHRFGNLKRRGELIALTRRGQQQQLQGETLLLVDSGDLLFANNDAGNVSNAKTIATALVAMGYQAVALGENDLAAGLARLQELIETTKLPLINSNIVAFTNKDKTLFTSHQLLTYGQTKIGICAVISPTLLASHKAELNNAGYEILAPTTAALNMAKQLKAAGAEALIVLTHLPWEEQITFAEAAGHLGLLIGGHSNPPTLTPKAMNGNLLMQASAHGHTVGVMDFIARPAATDIFDASAAVALKTTLMREELGLQALVQHADLHHPNPQQMKAVGMVQERIDQHEQAIENVLTQLASPTVRRQHLVFNRIIAIEE